MGVTLGKVKKPWSLSEGVQVGHVFQRLDADATCANVTDGDFHGGGTNGRGHVDFANLAVLKHSTVGMKWIDVKEASGTASEKDTVQLHWHTTF